MEQRHQVGPGMVVHVRYRLFDGEGEIAEESDPELPLSFLFGYGQLSPELEQGLEGMLAGESRRIHLPTEAAFGPRNPEAIIEVDRAELPPDAQVGDEFEADNEHGEVVSLVVLEVLEDHVVLDGNHPLAGQPVELEILVEAVRPASELEIALAEEELQANDCTAPDLLPGSRLLQRPTAARRNLLE